MSEARSAVSDRPIVVLNPNSSHAVTSAVDAALSPLKIAGAPAIECVTLESGPPAIESDEDVETVTPLVQKFVGDNADSADAFVIACFSDPGLAAARRIARVPVFGMAEAGYLLALTRGARFGVISILPAAIPRHRRYIRALGIESRMAGDLPLGLGVAALAQTALVKEKLAAVGAALTRKHGAEVLILGCAGLAGYRAELEQVVGVPVIEPVQAAVTVAIGTLLAAKR